jgi:protocatechuate 3,4-dioxygenase beta subunit
MKTRNRGIRAMSAMGCVLTWLVLPLGEIGDWSVHRQDSSEIQSDEDFDRAVEKCRSSDVAGALQSLSKALEANPQAVQRALLEPVFHNEFRDQKEFREIVHAAAVKHRISRLVLVSRDEPGEWIEITGHVVDADGVAVPGAIVTVFATDDQGRYHPEIDGEGTPRIFGTLVSDAVGDFVLATVRPGPYPGTRQARHIHIAAVCGSLRLARPHYAVFDDDPLLQEPQNAEQRQEAMRIEMKSVDGEARGTLRLPLQ